MKSSTSSIKRKPVKSLKRPLKRVESLRASKPKKTGKRVPLEKKTARELVKVADKEFSRYIRLRDAEYVDGQWVGTCIDCPKRIVVMDSQGKWKSAGNVGHYISRGVMQLRYDEMNCNLQSAHCNAWKDKLVMLDGYRQGLDRKYGSGTANRLEHESRQEGAHRLPTKEELLQIIHDCRTRIDIMLEMK